MKFTKEDAFKQIEGYLTDNGKKDLLLSKRSINAQLDTLMPLLADDETELSVFVDKVKPAFMTMWGNLKYDTTQFVKKWNEEHHPEAEKNEPEPAAQPANPEYEALMKRIEALEEERERNLRKAAVEGKRNELKDALMAKGIKDESWISDLLSEVAIDEKTDAQASADRYLKLYNRVHAHTPHGVTPAGATNKGLDSESFNDVAAIRKNREAMAKGEIKTN